MKYNVHKQATVERKVHAKTLKHLSAILTLQKIQVLELRIWACCFTVLKYSSDSYVHNMADSAIKY